SRSHAVARVVAGTVGDHPGVLRVVFGQMKDDLHQIGAYIGDLGEDAAADPERACTEGLTDGEADEGRADHLPGQEDQDTDHEEELHAYQEEPHTHAGTQGDGDDVDRLAIERCKGGPGICPGVDPHPEPGHAVRAEYSEDRAEKDDDYV